MAEKFSDIKEDFLEKWISAVNQTGIPKKAYAPQIKIITSIESSYSVGVIFNPYRFYRPLLKKESISDCPMCFELNDSNFNTYKNLAPGISQNFLITYNAFPHTIGSSIAIAKNIDGKEKPMYNTKNLEGLVFELEEVFTIANNLGLKVFHNNYGAGASIPGHEHWHLLNFGDAYDTLGKTYGFDAAEKVQSRKDRTVKIMPDFPFAHLIFKIDSPDRMIAFLKNLGEEIGWNYQYGHVPHSICQGKENVLIVPNKMHKERCIGSSDVAGHYLGCKSIEEFDSITLEDYFSRLGEILFKKEDIDLERFL